MSCTETSSRGWEHRLRALLETAVDGIVTADASGRIEMVNPAAGKLFGYEPRELVGRNVRLLMPSPYREEHDAYVGRYLETGERRIIGIGREVTGLRKDGSVFPIDLSISEVVVEGERIFMATIRDLTARKEAESALRRERDFAETLLQTAPVIILVLDVKGRIVRFNRYMEELSGYSLEEVQGRDWFTTFLPPQDRDRVTDVFHAVRAGEPSTGIRNAILTKHGEEREIDWYNKVLHESDEVREGVLAIGLDLTERRSLEDQFHQAQKMEAIGRLAGAVAHDFNTLLGSLTGYSEILMENLAEDDSLHNAARQIQRSAARGSELTRKLLTFSRRQALKPRVLDLNRIVSDMEPMLRPLLDENIGLDLRTDRSLWHVKAEPGHIEQVLMNLVVNACDAMPDGGCITVETSNVELTAGVGHDGEPIAGGEYACLTVRDAGCGMDEEIKSHLFEPFFTTKESGKGTGLGLATVYGIVKQSGGAISVESRPGEGSAFHIFLPRTLEPEEREQGELRPEPEPEPGKGSETVLLVEDDEMFRDLLHEILESAGYTVLDASSGQEALDLSEGSEVPLDLLVTDVGLPGISGTELARRVEVRHPGVRILLMSGYSDEVLEERGVEPGTELIHKPFSTKELTRRARRLLDS